jgi:hypothetical protein
VTVSTTIVVTYHRVGFSDIMRTPMIRHEIEEILKSVATNVSVSYTKPIGKTRAYVAAVVAKPKAELRPLLGPGRHSPLGTRPAHRHVW